MKNSVKLAIGQNIRLSVNDLYSYNEFTLKEIYLNDLIIRFIIKIYGHTRFGLYILLTVIHLFYYIIFKRSYTFWIIYSSNTIILIIIIC